MSDPRKEMLTRKQWTDDVWLGSANEIDLHRLDAHDVAQRAEIEELRALVGEDKLALFHRLKNEEAKATNRDTAGCQTCRAEIERLTQEVDAEKRHRHQDNAHLGRVNSMLRAARNEVLALAEQVCTLREALENAPHAQECPQGPVCICACWRCQCGEHGMCLWLDHDKCSKESAKCNCWKSVALSASPAPDDSIDKRADDLRKLQPNWDNDGAPMISELAISAAVTVLKSRGHLTPCSNGGVQIDWSDFVEISFGPDGKQEFEASPAPAPTVCKRCNDTKRVKPPAHMSMPWLPCPDCALAPADREKP